MARASITIEDDDQGGVLVGAEFGDKIVDESQAHQMIYQLLQSVLGTAKNFQQVEDTAGDLNGESAEPSRIIVPVE